MIGWLITNMSSERLIIPESLREFASRIDDYTVIYMRDHKFERDNFLFVRERGVVCTDGVLLNASEMKEDYCFDDLPTYLLDAGMIDPVALIRRFRGPYSGFLIDRQKGCTTFFTNAIGDRPVYVYNQLGIRLAASDLNMLIDFCRENDLPLTFNETAAKMILEFGFCVETCTMVREITRLFPGSCVTWDDDGEHEMRYHKLDNTENLSLSEAEAIEGLDRLFRQAVKRSFEKDNEYGYRHFADISAGRDSKIMNWVARDMGYKDILNICYGLPLCTDERVSARVASDLGNEFYFKSLADSTFMFDVDEAVRLSFGIALYIGPTGALRFIKTLNTNNIGLRHNGNMGGPVFGSYLCGDQHKAPGNVSGHNSSSRSHGPYQINFSRYENEEIQNIYARYLLADPISHVMVRDFVTAVSPFMDVDFMDYMLRIPIKYRRRNLYAKWIRKKYPVAARYPYNSRVFTIMHNKKISHFITASTRKSLDILYALLHRLGISKYRYRLVGMNPISAMYERSTALQDFFTDYYKGAVSLFDENPEFQAILEEEFHHGTATEKTLVLTVMSFVKQHQLTINKEREA